METQTLNREYAKRDTIIFGRVVDWATEAGGGIKHFDGIGPAQLDALLAGNYMAASDKQNEAPTAGNIRAFLHKYPEVRAHGYAVSPNRGDYRVSLEGVIFKGRVGAELERDFKMVFGDADEVSCTAGGFRAWYD